MKKKLLAMLMTFAMVMSLLPTAVFAGDAAVEVASQDELQAALDNCAPGTTIQLAEGKNYGVVYMRPSPNNPATKDNLDVQFDWTGNNYGYESLTVFENLTIKGATGATIDAIKIEGGQYYNTLHSQSETYPVMFSLIELKNVVIDGVTFTGNGGYDPQGHGNALNFSEQNIKVNGLTLQNCVLSDAENNNRLLYKTGYTDTVYNYTCGNEAGTFSPTLANITVTGCTFNGGYMGMELRETNNLTVTNNTFNGVTSRDMLLPVNAEEGHVSTYSGKITITGNTSDGAGDRFVRASGVGNATVDISNNIIKNYKGSDADFIKVDGITGTETVTMTGNTFDGVACVVEGDAGTYTVSKAVAQIGDVNYGTLAAAIEAATAGQTITLLGDITLISAVVIDENITLDGDEHKIDATAITGSDCALITSSGCTIKDLTITGNPSSTRAIGSGSTGTYSLNGTLTIDNVTIDSVQYAINGSGTSDAVVNVTNSEINGWNSFSGIESFNFTECTLTKGNSGEGYFVVYGNTSFTDCTFTDIFDMGARAENGEVLAAGKTIEFTDCTYGTADVTAENFEENFYYGEGDERDWGYLVDNCIIVVDGEILAFNETSLENALEAAQPGDTITLLKDVELSSTLTIGKSIILDGNGKNVTTSDGFVGNDSNAMLDIQKDITFNNVVFDGVKDVAVMRAVSADIVMDDCVVQNCEHTVAQGILRLAYGNATITDSKFLNNDCTMVISFGFDGANDTDVLLIDGCEFKENTCGETAVVYFADGDYGKVTDTKFIDNSVSAAANAATLYMGWGDGFEVSDCLFEGNTVTTSHATTKRFASAIFCDGCTVNGNAFVGNTATRNGETIATTVAVAAYYGEADVSGNYWAGGEPSYTVEYDKTVTNNSYYTTYSNGVLGGLAKSLIFNANGGAFAETSDSEISGFFASLPSVSRAGNYNFNGWYTAAVGGDKVTDISGVEAGTKLFAQWSYTGGSSSDSSSSSSTTVKPSTSSPTVSTDTTTNSDGSTTVTETKKDGTTVETTTNTDGSTTTSASKTEVKETSKGTTTTTATNTTTETADGGKVTEQKVEKVEEAKDGTVTATTTTKTETETADGSKKTEETVVETVTDKNGNETTTSTTETKLDNGSTGTTTVDEDGKVEAEVKVTSTAVKDAAKDDTTVTLPMPEVEATTDSESAPTVEIDVPSSANDVKVEIPVADASAGTVAVIVHADGTEEIIMTTAISENGVVIPVSGDVTVKIVDNSQDFEDVDGDDWYSDAADFVSSRGIMNGTDEESFAPATEASRAMVAVILHSMENDPDHAFDGDFHDVDDHHWYADGVHWAADNGIMSGTGDGGFGADDAVTREQLAVTLFSYANMKGIDTETGASLNGFADGHSTSDWAKQAVEWAVHVGLLSGKDGGMLDPTGTASRAEIAQILMAFCNKVMQ